MSWFDYSQYVLEKVSFDRVLFLKELRKLLRYLSAGERIQLLRWCRRQKPWQGAQPVLLPAWKADPAIINGKLYTDR